MGKINILFVIDNIYFGGAEQQLVHLTSGLDKERFHVSICNLGQYSKGYRDELESNGITLYSIPQSGFFDITCLIRLKTVIRTVKPHIVNTFLFTADLYGRMAASIGGVPIIISSVRNIDIWKRQIHLMADRVLARKTTAVTVNAAVIKEHLLKTLGIESEKVSVIYNGVDFGRFAAAGDPGTIRKELSIEDETKVILSVARYVQQKDLGTLIEASKRILKKRKDVVFVLAGEGPLKDDITEAIQRESIGRYFRLLRFRENIADIYRISSISVLTSLYEGCSNFILESMACGIPVVATSVGGNPELIEHNVTGFLLPTRDIDEISKKILFLLDNPEISGSFGDEARKRAAENFSIEKMVRCYEELYQSLYHTHIHR